MNWSDFVSQVAENAGVPRSTAQSVLSAMVDELSERLQDGDSVNLRGIGTLSRKWTRGRTLRSINNGRKIWVGGRHAVKFSVSRSLKRALEESGDQSWRSPEHQAAWRLAETLVSDLELYSPTKVPKGIRADMDFEEVQSLCAASLGDDWHRAWRTWQEKVAPEVVHAAHLARAARRRWAA